MCKINSRELNLQQIEVNTVSVYFTLFHITALQGGVHICSHSRSLDWPAGLLLTNNSYRGTIGRSLMRSLPEQTRPDDCFDSRNVTLIWDSLAMPDNHWSNRPVATTPHTICPSTSLQTSYKYCYCSSSSGGITQLTFLECRFLMQTQATTVCSLANLHKNYYFHWFTENTFNIGRGVKRYQSPSLAAHVSTNILKILHLIIEDQEKLQQWTVSFSLSGYFSLSMGPKKF